MYLYQRTQVGRFEQMYLSSIEKLISTQGLKWMNHLLRGSFRWESVWKSQGTTS